MDEYKTPKRRQSDNISTRPDRPDDIEANVLDTHPDKKTRFANKAALASLLLALLGVATFLFWSFADQNVLEVKNSPFPVRTIRQHPTADGVVILTVDLCKRANVEGKTRTSFVSESREVFLPLSDEKLPKGCLDNTEVPVLIPKDITPGTYKIKFRVTYDLNPVKKGIVNEFESKTFTVDPPATQ